MQTHLILYSDTKIDILLYIGVHYSAEHLFNFSPKQLNFFKWYPAFLLTLTVHTQTCLLRLQIFAQSVTNRKKFQRKRKI